MNFRHEVYSVSSRVLIAGMFLVVGVQGCTTKPASCEVVGTTGIVRYMTKNDLEKFVGSDRGEAPGVCGTVEVVPNESAAGFKMVNAAGTLIGTAPAGSQCAATTSKCSAPDTSAGCGRSTPQKYCKHTYVQLNPDNPVNPCTCTCQLP